MRILKIISALPVLAACFCPLKAQTDDYVAGDENYTGILAFHNVDTLLVVVPHNYSVTDQEKREIESYVFWDQYQKKPAYLYKNERELTREDELRNIQFYGPFCDFRPGMVQNIPVKQVKGGFSFNGEEFTRPTDSFFYLNDEATRLFTCRNSTQLPHQYANLAAGYFPLYIFRGMDLYLSGYCSDITYQPRVNYITRMRRSYFVSIPTKHFDFEVAKSICTDSLRNVIVENADLSLENLCAILKTDTVGLGRMITYVYSDMSDLQKFLCMSPRMTIYGKSFGPVNHVSSFDMAVFRHELAHTVSGRKIGVQPNSFFCEGLAVYTGYMTENNSYAADHDSTAAHLDLLTEEIIVGPDYRFYSIPLMYPISGVFTRFVIEKTGIDIFKEIYAQPSIEDAFREKGFQLEELIAEFKDTLRNGSRLCGRKE
jgi:hypothetical protein